MWFITKYTKYTVYCGLIIKYAVCCKFITKYAVYRNLLTNAANLLRNARFVRIAKDHIQLPRSYGSPQTAVNRNNQPQKKILDVNNLLLNIVSNSAPIYRDKYSILLKKITKVLYDIFLYKSLCFLYLFNKVLLYIILQHYIIIFSVCIVYYIVY